MRALRSIHQPVPAILNQIPEPGSIRSHWSGMPSSS